MFKLIFIALVLCIMGSEGVRRRFVRPVGSYAGAGGYAGSGAGSYAGSGAGGYAGSGAGGSYGGFGGGYVGGYAGTGDGGFVGSYSDDYGDYDPIGTPYAPDIGLSAAFIDPYVFHQQLTAQIQAQHAATQNLIHRQIAQQQYFDNVRRRNNFNHGGYNSNRYAPNYASASGSVGPGGFYQTAVVNPASAHTPNIVNRFSPASSSGGPGGYHGVSVSSFSGSSDVNGKRTNVQGAQTTVNENGKVTTYSVHS